MDEEKTRSRRGERGAPGPGLRLQPLPTLHTAPHSAATAPGGLALVQAACPRPQGCSGLQRGPLPGLSFEDEKTGLGQTQGPVSPSYTGKDGKEARKTATPGPFPHSGAVHTFPAQPHGGGSVHQQSGQAPVAAQLLDSNQRHGGLLLLSHQRGGTDAPVPRAFEEEEPHSRIAMRALELPLRRAPSRAGGQRGEAASRPSRADAKRQTYGV